MYKVVATGKKLVASNPVRRLLLTRALARTAYSVAPSLPFALGACTTVNTQPAPAVSKDVTWALLPMMNHTETPQAGLRGEAILESLLRSGGYSQLTRYPAGLNKESLFDPMSRLVFQKNKRTL